jgi:hypothetical protein
MAKFSIILFAISMTLSLLGCSEETAEKQPDPTPPPITFEPNDELPSSPEVGALHDGESPVVKSRKEQIKARKRSTTVNSATGPGDSQINFYENEEVINGFDWDNIDTKRARIRLSPGLTAEHEKVQEVLNKYELKIDSSEVHRTITTMIVLFPQRSKVILLEFLKEVTNDYPTWIYNAEPILKGASLNG